MPSFGNTSKERLKTCHPDLIVICNEVIKDFDFSVLCGHRNEAAQRMVYELGKSQVNWPDSKHNSYPSKAVDIAPYPIDWHDTGAFYMLAGWIECTAKRLLKKGKITHSIRLGADWNSNHRTSDQRFHDLPHIELVS